MRGRPPKPRTAPEPPPVEGARWIALTKDQFALVDEDDFDRVNQYNWSIDTPGYAKSSIDGIDIRLHKFICPDIKRIDHRNRNKLDNRKSNLRACNDSQNLCNIDKYKGVSKYRGVHPKRNKWYSQITVNRVTYSIGSFESQEEAAKAYNEAAQKLHGEFARLNVIEKK